MEPPPPVAEWALEACKAKQRGIRYKITGCHTRIQNIVTNNLSRRDAKKHLNDARNLLGDIKRGDSRLYGYQFTSSKSRANSQLLNKYKRILKSVCASESPEIALSTKKQTDYSETKSNSLLHN
ncbi:hypothetical protein DAPPUDRAFT_323077 [Daphnia pulex]|uniref:Uncharacterized protein n=1 Tax=Daphnia pulex TaxID=6669 RepID=E9GXV2_DAPPU|nr:hypothetical protein DAPPUDRAFT_323077 [Daphnia pulex]|eukprot:EFX75752.1 hypothetical protein DAPPUDRAFT_323077 [Daphnia pulex]